MYRFGGGGFGLWGRAAGGLLVALALIAATGGAARGEGRFPDVADDHRRRLDVLFAAEQGWFRGYPDGTFRPDASVADGQLVEVVRRAFPDGLTRAQLADFVVAGVETGAVEVVVEVEEGVVTFRQPESGFSDVPNDHPYNLDIVVAVQLGWFQGYPDGTFRPERTVTPAQIAKVLRRAFPSGSTRAELAAFMREGAATLPSAPAPNGGDPAALSPKDDILVYAVRVPGGVELWAAATDGTEPVRLVEDPVEILDFSRSPDGGKIVYLVVIRNEESAWEAVEMWVVGLDGTAPRRLVGGLDQSRCHTPEFWRWSPDGGNIAYEKGVRNEDGEWLGAELWVAGTDGSAPRRVSEHLVYDGTCWATGDWEWAPSGESIAYEAVLRGADGEPTGRGLWAAAADGSYHRLLTGDLTGRRSWQWGLAGFIAYSAGKNNPYELWTAAYDGRGKRLVTDLLDSDYHWTWSLDGGRIAYVAATRDRDGYWRGTQLRAENADGSGSRLLAENSAGFSGFRWSPDGERIAYKRSVRIPRKQQLYVVALDGSEPVMWSDNLSSSGRWDWSPNGESVAFQVFGELRVAAGGRETALLADNHLSYNQWWGWSPTGEDIAFLVEVRDEDDEYVGTELRAAAADGSNRRGLSGLVEGIQQIEWSPDGKRVAFWLRGERDEVWSAAADGSERRRLTHQPDRGEPYEWSPDGGNVAYKENGILWVEAADDPAERLLGWAGDYSMERAVRRPSPVRNIHVTIVVV